jgi:hypothetical protein
VPKPKTDAWYEERLAIHAEEGYKPAVIARILEEEAKESGRNDWPSPRTVQRMYERYLTQPEFVRRQFALVRWPETWLAGALPWESSQSILELLRYRDQRQVERPTVRVATWFWRVTLAAPSERVDRRAYFASFLAAVERAREVGRADVAGDPRSLEWYLAYRPWAGDDEAKTYEEAVSRASDPLPRYSFDRGFQTVNMGFDLHIMANEFGAETAKAFGRIFAKRGLDSQLRAQTMTQDRQETDND